MNVRRQFFTNAGLGFAASALFGHVASGQEQEEKQADLVKKTDPLVVSAADAEAIWAMGIRVTVMVTAEQTGGAYSVFEDIIPPGAGPPPHVHTREDETIFVLDGELRAWLGGVQYDVNVGDFVHMPRGVQHYFKNVSNKPTKMLLTYTPGGFEEWFKIVGVPVSGDSLEAPKLDRADLQAAVAAATRFGVEFQPKGE